MTEVRPATVADLPVVLEIDRRCFTRPWVAAAWQEELAGGTVFVAGSIALACAPIVLDRCELRRIAVIPQSRRSGVGRDLLAAVIDHARRAGCEAIELEVGASNLAAITLYRTRGFRTVGRRLAYYADPLDDALLMNLELGSKT